MVFSIITIFPEAFDSYLNSSILKRAIRRGLIKVKFFNPRDFAKNKHKIVDDKPFGGGAGMLLMAEPILRAVEKAKSKNKAKKRKIFILSAKGKQFTQRQAGLWAKKYDEIIFISGRYEGVDERVKTILKAEEISIGPYVLTDGDAASMVVISAVSRLIPGIIRFDSLKEESHNSDFFKKGSSATSHTLEYPQYTRPEVINWKKQKRKVPKVLLSGNHAKIEEWRRKHRK